MKLDEDLNKIINQIFSVEDAKIVLDMLEVVNKDVSDNSLAKRLSGLDYILNGVVK
jgi:hypothetical protein